MTATAAVVKAFQEIPIGQLTESKTNPRRTFEEGALKDLAASIRQKGILQPLLVRPWAGGFEIVAGARRFRAAKQAGLERVPAYVRELNDDQALEAQVIENLQRQDVHALEEAEGYREILRRGKYDVEELAAAVNRSKSYIYMRMKLCDLVPEAKKLFLEEGMTPAHAEKMARLQPADQKRVLNELFAEDFDRAMQRKTRRQISHRDMVDWIQRNVFLDLDKAPWKKDDELLLPKAGACAVCPKRAGAQRDLFPEVSKASTCTDRGCYEEKLGAYVRKRRSELVGEGFKAPPLLSAEYYVSPKTGSGEKVLGEHDYRLVEAKKGKTCPSMTKGVFVDGRRVGQVTAVCTDGRCATHRGPGCAAPKPPTPAEKERRKRELLKLRIQRETRKEILRAIAKKVYSQPAGLELRAVAAACASRLWHDVLKRLFEYKGWEPKKKKFRMDFEPVVREKVAAMSFNEVRAFLVEIALAPELDAEGSGWRRGSGDDLLASAKAWGVDPKAIERKVAEDLSPKKKAAAGDAKRSAKRAHEKKG